MEEILLWLGALPLWVFVCAGIGLLILILVISELLIRSRFWKLIRNNKVKDPKKFKAISPFQLRLHVRWLERIARKKKIPIMEIFDFRQPWLAKFKSGKRRKDLIRLLDFYPDFAFFPCFEVALKNKARSEDFLKRLGSGEESFFLLKKLGASCGGRDFDSAGAGILLKDHLGSLRELAGDGDWFVRDFAVSVLLSDPDPRSHRLLWEALKDSHAHVRATTCQLFKPSKEDRQKLYDLLLELFLGDPSIEVRRAAKKRISQDFKDLYKLSLDALGDDSVIHVLELLDPQSKEDENLAFGYLESPDPERQLASARFLQTAGALERIFLSVNFGDRETLQRTRERLEKAAGAQVLGFLPVLGKSDNPGTLFLAAQILQKAGDRGLIHTLIQKVFDITESGRVSVERLELYQAALKAVKTRGNGEAAQAVKDELQKKKRDVTLRALIWANIPVAFETLFVSDLVLALKDGLSTPSEAFHAAWKSLSPEVSFPVLLDFIKSGSEVPLEQKQEALALLGELRHPGLIQNLLESLPLLPPDQLPSFCQILFSINEKLFLERAGILIRSVDSRIKACVLLGLPAPGKKEYLKDIREALSDVDPDVRLAAFTSLSQYDEAKVLSTNAIKLLRDPVERVRQGVALALGKTNTESTVEELKTLVLSDQEVLSVRDVAAQGLGVSTLGSATAALLQVFPPTGLTEEVWVPILTKALSKKTEKRQILELIEHFKDSSGPVRKVIASALAAMGSKGEDTLMELLGEGIISLKPVICEAMEKAGAVDLFILRLGHRDPAVRKDAAGKLVAISTTKAFKGIVEAARDPSAEIRVLVTKALESLGTPAGAGILKELEGDPDKRVRRYTVWALERIRAKTL